MRKNVVNYKQKTALFCFLSRLSRLYV